MTENRRALLPAPTLPLVYFAAAHIAFAAAATLLTLNPDLPGGFHYHPRMIAIIHLVTLGWITGSILGAFYIVAPLAFGMPFQSRRPDHLGCASFWAGTIGMVAGFWRGDYAVVGCAAAAVLAGISVVAMKAIRGLLTARVPRGVALHIALAFVNVIAAGVAGAGLAAARGHGLLSLSPLPLAMAHAHAAVLGWAVMMIMGISYRLVPMFLPAAMPAGSSLAWSAILLETGTVGLAWSFVAGGQTLPWAAVIAAAFGVFMWQISRILGSRRPRPAQMSGRDWSVFQTHAALLWLIAAIVTGLTLAAGIVPASWTWLYGVIGIVGFAAQMVVGVQGRLLPLHAWYRAMTQRDGEPPPRSAYRLAHGGVARLIFLLWLVAVPGLAIGLITESPGFVAVAALFLLWATVLQAAHAAAIVSRAASRV